ncbi:glycosyltransferase [Heyndrickxia acidicola]|uniref:Glycosyltransferase n=1 Tax=Heyndrickxia acidicola TaxID=209389 RepID=A0ABU6MI44_9BACI|nr:glycosyltransferase [Heyndrickxia acidicola]MED1203676.1 glycosyltransferase [Heyndrickxia acidicola]
MEKLKLLVITGDFSKYVSPEFHYLLSEVAKLTDLTVWHEPGNINDIINTLPARPDFIFINEYGETNSPKLSGVDTLEIPFAVNLHDIHYHIEQRKEELRSLNVKAIFTYYRDSFEEWYPEFSSKMRWLPHHANTHIFKDYGMNKEIDYLLMGAVHPTIYSLRYKILEAMQNKPGFVYHEHPGYRNVEDHEKDTTFAGQRYAQEINKAKIFFTCNSIYNYTVMKYFEVLACRTLMLAPASPEILDLGFIPGKHFISITENDFLEKAEYYLHHNEEREAIALEGYRFIQEQHSTAQRARQFVNMVSDLIEKEN